MSTTKILSVTGLTGRDTIFRETELSQQLGLRPGAVVPIEVVPADTLFWVESARLSGRQIPPEKVRQLRHKLGLSEEPFAKLLGLSVRTIRLWEREGATSLVFQAVPDHGEVSTQLDGAEAFPMLRRLQL